MKEILDYIGLLFVALSAISGGYIFQTMVPSIIIFSAVIGILIRKSWLYLEKKKNGIYLISVFGAFYALLAYNQIISGSLFWISMGIGWLIIVALMMKGGFDSLANVQTT